ncbi:MAG: pyridoxal phosphate-dependent aminotransferase family protein [Bacteroidia bacterium]|nr:pyridoxal phosphate-dependent aminotransferase family protein [Bacteroidia bacterium]MCX7652238.1 pyridoxal phosphate-dependent aminotransferase family protein [Bacteroidia bacterium]
MVASWGLCGFNMSLRQRLSKVLQSLPERSFWQVAPDLPDFTTNDYLGLIRDGVIAELLQQVPSKYLRGSGASRYLGGDSEAFHEVEAQIELLWGRAGEKALFFPSGLTANLSFWSSVVGRDDVVIFDREIHASIRQALRLSGARAWGFPHNDWEAAERKLRQSPRPAFLVIESLYSMRGTVPDVAAIQALASRYEFYLVVDEAHTTLAWHGGRSWSLDVGLNPLARLFTFGKAGGLIGAAWVAPSWLIEYLRRVGFAGIYTTALPPFVAWVVGELLRRNSGWESRREKLWHIISVARSVLGSAGILYEGLDGPIALLYEESLSLPMKKLYPPTVHRPAYRLSLHAHNSEEELELLLRKR